MAKIYISATVLFSAVIAVKAQFAWDAPVDHAASPGSGGGIGCLDESGKPVDWWIVYKMPTVHDNKQSNNGYGYAYSDPTKALTVTGQTLKEETNALGYTLNQIYEQANTGYVMWNDETPEGKTTSSQAHSKGVMGFDLQGGFLLRHSTPRYPNDKKTGYEGLPENEKIYGQTYMCVSVDIPTLNNLAGQYLIAHPLVYDSNVLAGLQNAGNISSLAKGALVGKTAGSQGIVEFKTRGGTAMTDLVKSNHCSCDLWDAVVAPHYKQSMNVLSWGRPLEDSGCSLKAPSGNVNVQNIVKIAWGKNLEYAETSEHSKWGVTVDKKVICIGDINRMISQRKRGGGTTCMVAPQQAAAFTALVNDVAACK